MIIGPQVGAFVVQDRTYLGRIVGLGTVWLEIHNSAYLGGQTLRYFFGRPSMRFYPDALSAIKAIMKGSQA